MKNILFILPDLQVGGVTASFVNLIKLLSRKDSDLKISVLVMNDDNNDYISKAARVFRLTGKARLWNFSKKSNKYKANPKTFFIGFVKKIFNRFSLWNRFCFNNVKSERFDCVIGYKQSPAVLELVHVIDADKKICFWHGDPNYMPGISKWIKKISYIDKVACVSSYVMKQMAELFPVYKEKLIVVYNNIDCDEIKEKSLKQRVVFNKDIFNLVTVSRISDGDKNVFIIPDIASKLKTCDIKFRWRIIGNGPDMNRFKSHISSCGVNDVIELIDSQNVFSYVKDSDLLVLTSKTESFGMAIVESLLLGTPCVCSDLPSVREIVGEKNGVAFVENSVNDYCNAILNIFNNPAIYNNLLEKAKSFIYDSQKVYNQFCELINNEAR